MRGSKRAGLNMLHHIIWIHIVFFSTWLGANLFYLAIFLPASRSLQPKAQWQARNRASHGLNRVAAVSAPLVLISGFVLSAGLGTSVVVEWGNSSIIGGKLVLTVAMIINHWWQAFRYAPTVRDHQDELPPASDPQEFKWKAWVRLLIINVVLGFTVFLLGLSQV